MEMQKAQIKQIFLTSAFEMSRPPPETYGGKKDVRG